MASKFDVTTTYAATEGMAFESEIQEKAFYGLVKAAQFRRPPYEA